MEEEAEGSGDAGARTTREGKKETSWVSILQRTEVEGGGGEVASSSSSSSFFSSSSSFILFPVISPEGRGGDEGEEADRGWTEGHCGEEEEEEEEEKKKDSSGVIRSGNGRRKMEESLVGDHGGWTWRDSSIGKTKDGERYLSRKMQHSQTGVSDFLEATTTATTRGDGGRRMEEADMTRNRRRKGVT